MKTPWNLKQPVFDNIACLYLGVVHDWGDSQIRVSMEKSFHTGCDVSTSTSLGGGEIKERRAEESTSAEEELRIYQTHQQIHAEDNCIFIVFSRKK